jgi:hypothetical protein
MQEGDANRPGSGNPDVGGYETPSITTLYGRVFITIAGPWKLRHSENALKKSSTSSKRH